MESAVRQRWWQVFGPGILLAAASIGASHLVLSPQAGALFGYQLLWLVLASHLLKYPAFEFGPRYAAATGKHLLQGYARVPGPWRWALVLFLVSTLAQGVGVLAGVVSVAGCVLWTWTGWLSTEMFSVILTAATVVLLLAGGFPWMDHLNKLMMAVLALATVLAFIPVFPGPDALAGLLIPRIPAGSIGLVAAMLSWMPTGIDVSVWHSFWTVEKMQRAGWHASADSAACLTRLRYALADMRLGYFLSLATGLMFVVMGAAHLAGRGAELQGVQFAEALSLAYTAVLGRWMFHVFMLTAFFAMFSTSYTVIDGFSRSFAECSALLHPPLASLAARRRSYTGFVIGSSALACLILVKVGNPVTLVMAATLISLGAAPFLYALNLYCVTRQIDNPVFRPTLLSVAWSLAGILTMFLALAVTIYVNLPRGAE